MHIKSLKVFCDVVVRKSFSLAADANEISQSNASQMVQQLEERLGARLLDRSKRPFVLTREGEVFYQGCRKIVQRYIALEEEVRTLHEEVAGRVSIASIYSVGLSHMTRLVREFMAKHPKAKVHLQYQHPDRVFELVETGQVDLGLVSYAKSTRLLRALTWREEEMVLVCAPAHPLASRRAVKLEDLNGCDMVSFDNNLEIRREIDRALAARRVETNVVMEFDNIEILKRAIEIDAGVSLLPRPTVEREVSGKSLVAIPLAGIRLVRPLKVVLARDKDLGKTARRFIQLLREQPTNPDDFTNLDSESADSAGPFHSITESKDPADKDPADKDPADNDPADKNPANRISVKKDSANQNGAHANGEESVAAGRRNGVSHKRKRSQSDRPEKT